MSHIKVQFSLLKDINLIITTSSKNISEAKDDFKNAISKLDWEVKAQSDISVRAARAVGELRCYNTALNWYSNYLNTVYAKYATLESYQTRNTYIEYGSVTNSEMSVYDDAKENNKVNIESNSQHISNKAKEENSKKNYQQEVIDNFEKKNPDIKKDFDDFLNSGGEKNDLTDEEKREIKYRVYTADDRERAIFLSHLDKAKFKNTDSASESDYSLAKNQTAYWWFTHGIYLKRETNPYNAFGDERYDYISIYHEYGHDVDDLSDLKNWLGNDTLKYKAKSESVGKEMTITEAIMYDVYDNEDNPHSLINFYNKYKGTDLIDDDMTFEKYKKGVKSGKILSSEKEKLVYTTFIYGDINAREEISLNMMSVSDIYGGATQFKGQAKYGHHTNPQYWDNKSNLPSEAWAEYYAGHFIDDKSYLDNMREYLPTACEIMDSYADDLAKKARPINT